MDRCSGPFGPGGRTPIQRSSGPPPPDVVGESGSSDDEEFIDTVSSVGQLNLGESSHDELLGASAKDPVVTGTTDTPLNLYPPLVNQATDEEKERDPRHVLWNSELNSALANNYDPTTMMVAGMDAEEIARDLREVICKWPIEPGTTKCWKGSSCVRIHGDYSELREDAGYMIHSNYPFKPPLPKEFIAKVTWVNMAGDVYIVPKKECMKLPSVEPSLATERPQDYFWEIGSEIISVIENDLNKMMIYPFIRKVLDKKFFISGEMVVANLGDGIGWKRAVILSEREEDLSVNFEGNPYVKVQLIDSGEICGVRFTYLSRLPRKFYVYPPMAYRCILRSPTNTNDKALEELKTYKVRVGDIVKTKVLEMETGRYGNAWSPKGFSEVNPLVIALKKKITVKGQNKEVEVSAIDVFPEDDLSSASSDTSFDP